ncbi:hypothetical protein [Actinomadura madurae]|uniref:hypothetical protein n=1 Tax=Actinomadura madurae TaxID=1993 RepID=UPI0020D218D4|nr:hypothetical protein [Actinomadura madurae]MCQ0014322.1 hypothetical protein [Actinomadura madurae]
MKVAGAPISWGVCEVPGWGHQMKPARVLAEMRDAGLAATELGPEGFLPGDAQERDGLLASHGLGLVGAFVPLVLHDPSHDPLPAIDRALADIDGVLVLAAATGLDGYDERPVLDTRAWSTLLANLDAITARAAARGRSPRFIRTSGRSWSSVRRWSACSADAASRCASTRDICWSAAPTRCGWRGSRRRA